MKMELPTIMVDGRKTSEELESGWYNKNLKKIKPKESEIGAILYVTKNFDYLYDFLDKLDFKRLTKKVPSASSKDVIIDVFNGWCDITIKVYSKNKKR